MKRKKLLFYEVENTVLNDRRIFEFDRIWVWAKAEFLQLKLIHLFARELLQIKKLEIEKTKHTFIVSILKVEY